MVRLYLREELHCLGNPNVPAVLRWQNLMSKAKEYNHLPFPRLEQQRAITIQAEQGPFPEPETNREASSLEEGLYLSRLDAPVAGDRAQKGKYRGRGTDSPASSYLQNYHRPEPKITVPQKALKKDKG